MKLTDHENNLCLLILNKEIEDEIVNFIVKIMFNH